MSDVFVRRVMALAAVTLTVSVVALFAGAGLPAGVGLVCGLVGLVMAVARPWLVGRRCVYRVTFELDGGRVVEPMVFEAGGDPDELAELIYERARRHVTAGEVEGVLVDLDDGTGCFFVPVCRFTVEVVEP